MRPPKHRWTAKDARAHLRHAIDQLAWLEEHAERVWRRAESDSDVGLRARGDGRASSADPDGASNGPTPRIALARLDRTDDVALALNGLLNGLALLSPQVLSLRRHAAFLLGLSPEDARKLSEPVDRGKGCDHCGRWIANTPADRIRAGRCGACYEYRRTHQGQDRLLPKREES